MQHRQDGINQETAAAKAGFSVRTGRRIEQSDPRHVKQRAKLSRLEAETASKSFHLSVSVVLWIGTISSICTARLNL